jgi:bifunctional dethiobiotin synthetase / adenosylmethionine---8-amino-7-oxononanoate aminotransferase
LCSNIQGAGGILMIDPLFQRVLVSECKSRKIHVIFDEVFLGFWRRGVEIIFDNTFSEDK